MVSLGVVEAGPLDDYEHLGPAMRARLDRAELDTARLRDYVALLARRGPNENIIAGEICLLLTLAQPKPWACFCGDPNCLGSHWAGWH